MKRISPFLAATAMAVASATAILPASAASASTVICRGTSPETGELFRLTIRVPTVGNGTPSQWQCNLLPSNTAGLVPVERLQIDLNDCYDRHLTVDGEYGQNTENAVKFVQAGEGVTQDGDYGPHTIEGRGGRGGGFHYQASGQPVGICDSIVG